MRAIRKVSRIQVLLLSLLSSVVFPAYAGAQPSETGRFTLTSEVRWGSLVLPAGKYTYGVESGTSSPLVIVYSANGEGRGFIFPASVSEIRRSEPGQIVLEEKDGESVVTTLYVKELGLALHYKASAANSDAATRKLALERTSNSQGK